MRSPLLCPSWTYPLVVCFLLSPTLCSTIICQSVDWEYEIEMEAKNIPAQLWITNDQELILNLKSDRPTNPGICNSLDKAIHLNAYGNKVKEIDLSFDHITKVLMPLNEELYLTNRFDYGTILSDDSSNENFIIEGLINENFYTQVKNYFTAVRSAEGFSFFKNAPEFMDYKMIWGNINQDLQYEKFELSLEEIRKEGLGITNNGIAPVQLDNGTWIIPVQYGEVKGSALSLDHGTLLGMKDNKLTWKFPQYLDEYNIQGLCKFQNTIGLLERPAHCGTHHVFIRLDSNGREISKIKIDHIESFSSVLMNKSTIVLVNKNEIFIYEHNGELRSKIYKEELNATKLNSAKWINETNFAITATRENTAVVYSLNIGSNNSQEEIIEQENSHDAFTNKPLILSAYPNPASQYINFEFKNLEDNRTLQLSVYTVSGELIMRKEISSRLYRLELDNITSGQYVYQIIDNTGENRSTIKGRFIKID